MSDNTFLTNEFQQPKTEFTFNNPLFQSLNNPQKSQQQPTFTPFSGLNLQKKTQTQQQSSLNQPSYVDLSRQEQTFQNFNPQNVQQQNPQQSLLQQIPTFPKIFANLYNPQTTKTSSYDFVALLASFSELDPKEFSVDTSMLDSTSVPHDPYSCYVIAYNMISKSIAKYVPTTVEFKNDGDKATAAVQRFNFMLLIQCLCSIGKPAKMKMCEPLGGYMTAEYQGLLRNAGVFIMATMLTTDLDNFKKCAKFFSKFKAHIVIPGSNLVLPWFHNSELYFEKDILMCIPNQLKSAGKNVPNFPSTQKLGYQSAGIVRFVLSSESEDVDKDIIEFFKLRIISWKENNTKLMELKKTRNTKLTIGFGLSSLSPEQTEYLKKKRDLHKGTTNTNLNFV